MYSNITNYIYIISSLDPELNPFFPVGLHNTTCWPRPTSFSCGFVDTIPFPFHHLSHEDTNQRKNEKPWSRGESLWKIWYEIARLKAFLVIYWTFFTFLVISSLIFCNKLFLLLHLLRIYRIIFFCRAEVGNPDYSMQFGLILEIYCRGAKEHIEILTRQVGFCRSL